MASSVRQHILPMYDQYFPAEGETSLDWTSFKDYKYRYSTKEYNVRPADFTLMTKNEPTWQEIATKICLVILKIILFPWGLYEAVKLLAREIGMNIVYPAHTFSNDCVEVLRPAVRIVSDNVHPDWIVRDVVLNRDGSRYSGMVIGKSETLSNRKWALLAVGNLCSIELSFLMHLHSPFLDAGYNVLLVNGPCVGLSKGTVTEKEIGDVQELGLRYLEDAVKAKNIIFCGHSLGGMAIAGAVEKHTFHTDRINYFAMRMMTFDKLSNIIKKLGGCFANWVRWWLDCEIDSIGASRKLKMHNIHEVIFKGENDTYMEGVDLLDAVENEGLDSNKTLITVPGAGHLDIPKEMVKEQILKWDQQHPIGQIDHENIA